MAQRELVRRVMEGITKRIEGMDSPVEQAWACALAARAFDARAKHTVMIGQEGGVVFALVWQAAPGGMVPVKRFETPAVPMHAGALRLEGPRVETGFMDKVAELVLSALVWVVEEAPDVS